MPEFGGMLAIVSAHAYDLRGANRDRKFRVGERDMVHALGAKIFHVAADLLWRRHQQSRDFVAPGYRLDQAVLGFSIPLKPAISHKTFYLITSA
jgi:hypothetical protein